MPRVTFVNEHREVQVERGRLLSDIAEELSIAVVRAEFAHTGVGDSTVWIAGAEGCVSPPTWYERWIKRCKGQRRLASRARVLGDCKVWTQQGIGSRAGVQRTLEPAPRAGEDGSEKLDHAHSPAGTAWNPYGHPKAVGGGTREAPVYEAPAKKGKEAAKDPPVDGDGDAKAKAKAAALAKAEALKAAKAASAGSTPAGEELAKAKAEEPAEADAADDAKPGSDAG
jgi:hypothetical protein